MCKCPVFVVLGVTETETGTETARTAPETGTEIGTETGIGTGTETGTETETQSCSVSQLTSHRPSQLCLLSSRWLCTSRWTRSPTYHTHRDTTRSWRNGCSFPSGNTRRASVTSSHAIRRLSSLEKLVLGRRHRSEKQSFLLPVDRKSSDTLNLIPFYYPGEWI